MAAPIAAQAPSKAAILALEARFQEAEEAPRVNRQEAFEEVYYSVLKQNGKDHPLTFIAARYLADYYVRTENYIEAEPLIATLPSLAFLKKDPPTLTADTSYDFYLYGASLYGIGFIEEGETHLRRAAELARKYLAQYRNPYPRECKPAIDARIKAGTLMIKILKDRGMTKEAKGYQESLDEFRRGLSYAD
jgi:hypothetical protein